MPNNSIAAFPLTVVVRGAGEQASGVGWALTKAGFRVIMTEVANPLMVRWPVSFGTAVAEGSWQVDGVTACRVDNPLQCGEVWREGKIPVLIDPKLTSLSLIKPSVLVDAILAKCNTGTEKDMAPFTVALGPGFTAGKDVDVVIETNRGHDLGRLIYTGEAEPNTGIPGIIAGVSKERVVYSPMAGVFTAKRLIGEMVELGDILGEISDGTNSEPVVSPLNGVLRGLLRTGTPIGKQVKAGDVDPRGQVEYCRTMSEKARLLGSSVLVAICEWYFYRRKFSQGLDERRA